MQDLENLGAVFGDYPMIFLKPWIPKGLLKITNRDLQRKCQCLSQTYVESVCRSSSFHISFDRTPLQGVAEVLPLLFMRYVLRAEKKGQEICSSRTTKTPGTCQSPIFTSRGSSTTTSHKKELIRFQVQTELSNSSIFLNHHAAKSAARGTRSKMKKKKGHRLRRRAR